MHFPHSNPCGEVQGSFAIQCVYWAVCAPSIVLHHCCTMHCTLPIHSYQVINVCWAYSLQRMPQLVLHHKGWLTQECH